MRGSIFLEEWYGFSTCPCERSPTFFFKKNHSAKDHSMLLFTGKQAFDTMGNIILADSSNDRIRQISACGFVTTVAGKGVASSIDGLALASTFNTPIAVAVDSSNNIYVADTSGFRIRRISGGIVTTLVGTTTGWFDAAGAAAKLAAPRGMAFDTSSNLYIADAVHEMLFVITIMQRTTETIIIIVLIAIGRPMIEFVYFRSKRAIRLALPDSLEWLMCAASLLV
jgi:hypothetical protein